MVCGCMCNWLRCLLVAWRATHVTRTALSSRVLLVLCLDQSLRAFPCVPTRLLGVRLLPRRLPPVVRRGPREQFWLFRNVRLSLALVLLRARLAQPPTYSTHPCTGREVPTHPPKGRAQRKNTLVRKALGKAHRRLLCTPRREVHRGYRPLCQKPSGWRTGASTPLVGTRGRGPTTMPLLPTKRRTGAQPVSQSLALLTHPCTGRVLRPHFRMLLVGLPHRLWPL